MLNNDDVASGKFSKERITVLFCINLCGEKLPPLVIGKSKKPRSLKNVDITGMNLKYEFNVNSWMTFMIFKNWLDDFNDQMIKKKRKVLLLLDNAPVHPIDTCYSNIELLYYPSNTTSFIQPCDQGIIKSFKSFYKKFINNKIIFEPDNPKNESLHYSDFIQKITIYDALCFIQHAWE